MSVFPSPLGYLWPLALCGAGLVLHRLAVLLAG